MTQENLISVVICTYNGEPFLREQLDSILNQTWINLEIIISDDRSTDATLTIAHEYAARDLRIKIFKNDSNLGLKKNFERALGYASAEWIAISDQDDIWLPKKIEKLVEAIIPGSLMVHSYNAEFQEEANASVIHWKRKRFHGSNTRELIFHNTIYGHTVLVHRKLVRLSLPFPPNVYYDYWLGLIASLHGSVSLSNESLVLHREHQLNYSRAEGYTPQNKKAFFKEKCLMLKEMLNIDGLNKDQKNFIEEFYLLIKKESQKKFSIPVLLFFLRQASTAFYYVNKKPKLFYYLKYSFKRATMKLKHWY
ncbi:MAG TPA: glycosyltransferase family 2 protein [Flavisolibacter sp.]|nr:glycosyltransferase family 2 protein [Flavisolibacter sp.]